MLQYRALNSVKQSVFLSRLHSIILYFPAHPDAAVFPAAGPWPSALLYRGGSGPASNPAAGREQSA